MLDLLCTAKFLKKVLTEQITADLYPIIYCVSIKPFISQTPVQASWPSQFLFNI